MLIKLTSYIRSLRAYTIHQRWSSEWSKVTIDGITSDKIRQEPGRSALVPQNYIPLTSDGKPNLPQSTLHHLRWMLQKDNLGQDVFLIGRPGCSRRHLAMAYLQLTNQEHEYIALSRDTTESDMKQRREISNGTSIYIDQAAVRAAIEGRILIIDGVEKAERNILPILNNLLENRELHLEDGRFLVSAKRYDSLIDEHGKEVLDKMGMVRVSQDFRVIALGLPVPKYRGAPLDPPLRSRFQSRDIGSLQYGEMLQLMIDAGPKAPLEKIKRVLGFAHAITSSDSNASLPDFPIDNLQYVARIMSNNPSISEWNLLQRLYPVDVVLTPSQRATVVGLADSLKIDIPSVPIDQRITDVRIESNNAHAKIYRLGEEITIDIPTTGMKHRESDLIAVPSQKRLLADMIQTYLVGDFCLVGPRGSGKTALTEELCRLIHQPVDHITCYRDMSTRELIQMRNTRQNGDTEWVDSALVRAAKAGHVIVLDGIHRLHSSTMSIIHRLVHDRELYLNDGTRLMRHDRYDDLLVNGYNSDSIQIIRIHPAFRVIALAEPPQLDTTNWLTPELLTTFMYHRVNTLTRAEEVNVIEGKCHQSMSPAMSRILDLAQNLRERSSSDPILRNFAEALSTRQLLRIAHRLTIYKDQDNSLYDIVQQVFLSQFLPALPRQVLEGVLREHDLKPSKKSATCEVKINGDHLQIGNTSARIQPINIHSAMKVPSILFYDTPHYIQMLESLLQDFELGYHLCLIGNQGVGKNKLADRLLQLLNYPREYIQLHRDTTVQSLTIQPAIVDGRVVYEDSPLVRAVRSGHTLVIDEIDKAPTHVTCVLKSLVESGEMWLSDNRKIVPFRESGEVGEFGEKLIVTHPNFRIIVLANRPGFPFLGNDFFASMGHLFSCHAIDNPEAASEIELLRQYGPNVDIKLINKLVHAFGELRQMADTSQINYPYSTREVVNIVKHLERYPDDPCSELIGNVLDFDRYAPEALEQVTNVLMKHGLPVESYARNELAELRRQREIQLTVSHFSGKDVSSPKHGKIDEKNEPHVGGNTWAGGSGGRDTAGLGGKGGPYRLDAGHKVHQLSAAEIAEVPEEVKRAARELNRKAFEERLKEIEMSKYDANLYEQFSRPVRPHVNTMRNVLNALEAKAKERHWQKHQTAGELDDMKLIEGIAGEKNIYKQRADVEPEPGQPQERPKRLTIVADVSGSMYRFNGYDGRLDRQLEAVTMIMESFEGFESKIRYDIVGHSGESPAIPFVDSKNPPSNEKRRMDTLRMMHAHSQYCWQGDNTLQATKLAIDSISDEECDEAIVVVLSDANLQRYSIPVKKLTEMITRKEPKVQGFIVFLGSLGEEAEMIKRNMPQGKCFLCMEDIAELPKILKTIFQSSLLRQNV